MMLQKTIISNGYNIHEIEKTCKKLISEGSIINFILPSKGIGTLIIYTPNK